MSKVTWHDKHTKSLTRSDRLADSVAKGMGSWRFIIITKYFCFDLDGVKCRWIDSSLGCVPVYFIESYFFNTGSICRPHHHDVSKQAEPKRQDTGTGRLSM